MVLHLFQYPNSISQKHYMLRKLDYFYSNEIYMWTHEVFEFWKECHILIEINVPYICGCTSTAYTSDNGSFDSISEFDVRYGCTINIVRQSKNRWIDITAARIVTGRSGPVQSNREIITSWSRLFWVFLIFFFEKLTI